MGFIVELVCAQASDLSGKEHAPDLRLSDDLVQRLRCKV